MASTLHICTHYTLKMHTSYLHTLANTLENFVHTLHLLSEPYVHTLRIFTHFTFIWRAVHVCKPIQNCNTYVLLLAHLHTDIRKFRRSKVHILTYVHTHTCIIFFCCELYRCTPWLWTPFRLITGGGTNSMLRAMHTCNSLLHNNTLYEAMHCASTWYFVYTLCS